MSCLDVATTRAVTFTGSPAGVVADRRAGMLTVGVGDADRWESLEGFGTDRVAPALSALLDPRLTTDLDGKQ